MFDVHFCFCFRFEMYFHPFFLHSLKTCLFTPLLYTIGVVVFLQNFNALMQNRTESRGCGKDCEFYHGNCRKRGIDQRVRPYDFESEEEVPCRVYIVGVVRKGL